jgi:hypothetical protein
MTRDEALALGPSAGGKAVKDKVPPETCPRCQQPMIGRVWHSYLGHLGLHGLADKRFGGDIVKGSKTPATKRFSKGGPGPLEWGLAEISIRHRTHEVARRGQRRLRCSYHFLMRRRLA